LSIRIPALPFRHPGERDCVAIPLWEPPDPEERPKDPIIPIFVIPAKAWIQCLFDGLQNKSTWAPAVLRGESAVGICRSMLDVRCSTFIPSFYDPPARDGRPAVFALSFHDVEVARHVPGPPDEHAAACMAHGVGALVPWDVPYVDIAQTLL